RLPTGMVSSNMFVGRIYVYFPTLPVNNVVLLGVRDNLGYIGGATFNASDNKIYAEGGAGGLGSTGVGVTTGQWYQIDVKFNASANPRLIDVKVNGVNCGQRSDAFSATTITSLDILSCGSLTGPVYADDFVMSTTSG